MPQLVRTALDVLQASSFAKYADKRETMATNPREFYRLPAAGQDSPRRCLRRLRRRHRRRIQRHVRHRPLPVRGGRHHDVSGPGLEFVGRGAQADLLVFGGDEVYPVASALQYEQRLNEVLRTAAGFDKVVDLPPVMALPGNHDWYDGLASFRRNFCESWVQRDAPAGRGAHRGAGAATGATTSAAGVRSSPAATSRCSCPRSWWLWAVDSQLDAPIDAEQLSYFRGARRHLGDAKVILCTATPELAGGRARGRGHLLRRGRQPALHPAVVHRPRARGRRAPPDPARADRRPAPLRALHLHHPTPPPAAPPLTAEPFGPELVTCGGGGAFLASTHHLPDQLSIALRPWPSGSGATVAYERASCYPDVAKSRAIGRSRFLSAAWRNGPSLPFLIGAVDVALFLTFLLHWPFEWPRAWQFWVAPRSSPCLLGLYAASGADAVQPRRRRQWVTGLLLTGHTLAHLVAAGAVAALVAALVADPARPPWYGYVLAIWRWWCSAWWSS